MFFAFALTNMEPLNATLRKLRVSREFASLKCAMKRFNSTFLIFVFIRFRMHIVVIVVLRLNGEINSFKFTGEVITLIKVCNLETIYAAKRSSRRKTPLISPNFYYAPLKILLRIA